MQEDLASFHDSAFRSGPAAMIVSWSFVVAALPGGSMLLAAVPFFSCACRAASMQFWQLCTRTAVVDPLAYQDDRPGLWILRHQQGPLD